MAKLIDLTGQKFDMLTVIEKAPSAGLFDSQTDEGEMGFTYAELDSYLLNGEVTLETKEKIQKMHNKSNHKREGIKRFAE